MTEDRILNSELQNIEYRTAECRRVESLCSVFFKIDRIHPFDIRYSLFDIRFFRVSFSIKLAALAANAWADTLTPDTRHLKPKSLKTTESKT
jgi:hypothetical protein